VGAAPIGERHWGGWVDETARRFEEAFGYPGQLEDPGRLLDALRRLDRAAGAMAELNGWRSCPRCGWAVSILADLIAAEAADRRERQLTPVRHLGYFVPLIKRSARQTEEKLARRRKDLKRRARLAAAIKTVERLRDPDPATGGRASAPSALGGSGG
jgi:hypothetical protein